MCHVDTFFTTRGADCGYYPHFMLKFLHSKWLCKFPRVDTKMVCTLRIAVWLEIYWYYFYRNLCMFCSLGPHVRYMAWLGKQMTVLRTRLVNLFQEMTASKWLFWFTALHVYVTNLVDLYAPCLSAYMTWHVVITQWTCALYINIFTTLFVCSVYVLVFCLLLFMFWFLLCRWFLLISVWFI